MQTTPVYTCHGIAEVAGLAGQEVFDGDDQQGCYGKSASCSPVKNDQMHQLGTNSASQELNRPEHTLAHDKYRRHRTLRAQDLLYNWFLLVVEPVVATWTWHSSSTGVQQSRCATAGQRPLQLARKDSISGDQLSRSLTVWSMVSE